MDILLDDLDTFRLYCCRDAFATRLIVDPMIKELKDKNLWDYYVERVQPFVATIVNMNKHGVWIDDSKREAAIEEIEKNVTEIQSNFDKIVGRHLNVNGDELGEWLFEELKVPGGKKTAKTKKWSTGKDLLKEIKANTPDVEEIIDMILEIRGQSKIVGSFLDVTKEVDENGRLHPNFRIGPVTGRLACKRPNFQNVPKGICRAVYAAPPGFVFVGADYSQLELRIFALNSGCKRLRQVFDEGKDPHRLITSDAMDKPLEEVEDWERRIGKNFVFGMIFGAGDDTLVKTISKAFKTGSYKVRYAAGVRAKSNFFKKNPEALIYRNQIKREIERTKMIYTRDGRPRIFFGKMRDALGQAGNFPMQGSAAGLMNERMVIIDKDNFWPMLMQVHDFVMLEVPEAEAQQAADYLTKVLEAPSSVFDGYQFPVDCKIGKNWSEV